MSVKSGVNPCVSPIVRNLKLDLPVLGAEIMIERFSDELITFISQEVPDRILYDSVDSNPEIRILDVGKLNKVIVNSGVGVIDFCVNVIVDPCPQMVPVCKSVSISSKEPQSTSKGKMELVEVDRGMKIMNVSKISNSTEITIIA